jgi:PAS domain S-box-containing protein
MVKHAEFKLAPGAETFANLFEKAPIGYFLIDADGVITRVNRRGAAVLQRPAAELVGRAFSDFSPDTPLERVEALARAEHWPSGDPLHRNELQIRLPAGELRWIRATVDPVFDSAGGVTLTRMLVEDVSEEMAGAAGLRHAGGRFRIAFENAPVGMHLSTAGGRFLEVNRALCGMLGYSEEQLLSMQVWDVVHPDDLASFAPARAALFAGERVPVQVDSRFVKSDGSIRWCRLTAILPNGSEGYLVSQVADITDLVELQRRLDGLVKSKDRFIATVSHELRTPLAGVLGFSSELRDRAHRFSPVEVAEFADLIARGCVTVSNLVEDLLVAARLETADIGLAPEPTDLHLQALTWSADSRVISRAEGKSIAVEGQSAIAWADPNRVSQIIRNLVGNAARYGGNRTTVHTGVTADPKMAFLRVVDDGPGVPEQLDGVLFQPYQHGPQEPGQTEAVGLGLYLCRNLARLMDGDLTYLRQGGTTVFELTLPRSGEATTQGD